jgi:hypothetical protein
MRTLSHSLSKKRSHLTRIVFALICTALILATMVPLSLPSVMVSAAATKTVSPGQSIQSVLNSMSSGDICSIMPGTYIGALTVPQSGITVRKQPGSSGEVVINANRSTYAVLMNGVSNVTLDGLTITNAGRDPVYIENGNDNKVLNCKLTEYGMNSDAGAGSGGVYQRGGARLTVQGCTILPGRSRPLADYYDNYNTYIFVYQTAGGHKFLNNYMEGSWDNGGGGSTAVLDGIGSAQTNSDTDFNDTLIDGNTIIGAWDDLIEADGQCRNTIISNNWLEARGARVCVSITPCETGPVHFTHNTMLDWTDLAIKEGILMGGNAGPKYFDGNTMWSDQNRSYAEYGGIGTANDGSPISNHYITDNRIHSRFPIALTNSGEPRSCSGNTLSSRDCRPSDLLSRFPNNTIADFPRPSRKPDPTPTPTPTITPTPAPTPAPSAASFGLDSGNTSWADTGSVLNTMRFQNTAASGTLTKLELLYDASDPHGKVRLGVYADSAGKPGQLLLDAGEVPVANRWVSISNLRLPVTKGAYYWLAFNQESSNNVAFLSSSANPSNIPHYWTGGTLYGALPAAFDLTNCGNNRGPYIMRATVTSGALPSIVNCFGLDSGDSSWDQNANILDAMRFLNAAGTGALTKLELLINDTAPTGKVRLGIYADNNGRPGRLLQDAGAVTVVNGWVVKSGLKVPVTNNTHYWLAFLMQKGNTVRYQSGQADGCHYWVSRTYGTLPSTYAGSGVSTNSSPYVMRATVTVK